MAQKYPRSFIEHKIKILPPAIESKKRQIAKGLNGQTQFELDRAKERLIDWKRQLSNAKYLLKRMGKNDYVEIPSSTLPYPNDPPRNS